MSPSSIHDRMVTRPVFGNCHTVSRRQFDSTLPGLFLLPLQRRSLRLEGVDTVVPLRASTVLLAWKGILSNFSVTDFIF